MNVLMMLEGRISMKHVQWTTLSSLTTCACMATRAQVVGMVGSPRKRMLLLWHALELARSAPLPPPAPVPGGNAQAIQQQQLAVAQERADLLLRLAAKLLEPPEDPRDCLPAGPGAGAGVGVSGERLTALVQALSGGGMAAGGASQGQGQAGSSSGAKGGSAAAAAGGASGNGAAGAKGSRWAHKPWDTVRCAVLEAALSAARQLGAAVDAWEAAAALLRCAQLRGSCSVCAMRCDAWVPSCIPHFKM